jgi:Ca2+-binding RTX toxin-like protein
VEEPGAAPSADTLRSLLVFRSIVATPNSGVEGILSHLSADAGINALLIGTQWASGALTYSFVGPGSTFSTNASYGYGPGSEPWAPQVSYFAGAAESAAASALSKWSAVANVTFTLVADAQDSCGDLRFGFSDIGDAHAEAFSPAIGAGGDVWFSNAVRFRTFAEGSYNYMALLHEVGHSLGLKHPFSPSISNTAVLPAALDSQSHTVMSYSARPGDTTSDFTFRPTTPMVRDIQAIQYLYGANTSHNAGATLYEFREGGDYHQTIWDAGGRDTIGYEGSDPSVIDLRPGAGSMLGNTVSVLDGSGGRLNPVSNVWIANGAEIENAWSGSGADLLVGNRIANHFSSSAGDDILVGGAGNDRLDGGAGQDIVVFAGASADYTVTFSAATGRYAVGDRVRGRDGIDVVSDVEVFQFGDSARRASQVPISAPVTGDVLAVIAISEGFFGMGPGQPQFTQAMGMAASNGLSHLALAIGDSFSAMDSAALAADVLANFGVSASTLGGADPEATFAAVEQTLTGIFALHGHARGQVVLNIGNLLASLESDPVYGQAAAAFQNLVAADFNLISAALTSPVTQEPSFGVWV